MSKMRGFKPSLWTDERVMDVSRDARLLWLGLWTFSCDSGHIEDSPIQIKAQVFPGDPCTRKDVDGWLNELAGAGLITREGGVITTPNFAKHQKLDPRHLLGCSLVEGCMDGANRTKRGAHRAASKADPPSIAA